MYLLFTHSRDEYCVDLVQAHLNQSGHRSLIIYTDSYPFGFQTVYSPLDQIYQIINDGEVIDLMTVNGIWIRKWAGAGTFSEKPFPHQAAVHREGNLVLEHFINNLPPHIFVMDRMRHIRIAEDKMLQLNTAVELGIAVPDTLITNHPIVLSPFLSHGNKSVKMQTTLSWGMEGSRDFFYTTKIQNNQFPNLQGLEKAPLTYQSYIDKRYEYRVVFVDGVFYCGQIPESICQSQADWRTPGTEFNWSVGELPSVLKTKLTRLMERLQLKFGVMDILEDNEQNYYFLEVNPIGEWGMLEKQLNLPISKQIADTLIKNTQKNAKG
jgi:hypothetical protein